MVHRKTSTLQICKVFQYFTKCSGFDLAQVPFLVTLNLERRSRNVGSMTTGPTWTSIRFILWFVQVAQKSLMEVRTR